MKQRITLDWLKICLFNLLIVAAYGVLMRYKIGFEFAWFNQKNLQHAHSHFAFAGWIGLLLMVLMAKVANLHYDKVQRNVMNRIFSAMLISAYGMLVSFTIQGYGLYSIVFSTLSILVSVVFGFYYFTFTKKDQVFAAKKWMYAAIIFNILSAVGTFYLSYMMATKTMDQHNYLASVYWYLHFQYNGWFFFACAGLFVHYLHSIGVNIFGEKRIFILFVSSCVPAYGLSILWLNLPVWLYSIVVVAALAQFAAMLLFLREFIRDRVVDVMNLNVLGKILLLAAGTALFVKFALQMGSTIPAVSIFAFGFRPIVIAYLHLVLLAFTSVFLIFYLYSLKLLKFTNFGTIGIFIFLIGVFLNEFVLGVQGIASLSYTLIPYANESLFGIALLMLIGLAMANVGKTAE